MKPKNNPKIVVLTDYDIAIGEFKNTRDFKNWKKVYNYPIKKTLHGKMIKNTPYLPLF